jgi:hypothetical protein
MCSRNIFFGFLSALILVFNSAYGADNQTRQSAADNSGSAFNYLAQNKGCAVIYGGKANGYYGGSNINKDQFFYAINQAVVDQVYGTLMSENYKVFKVMLAKPEAGMNLAEIGQDLPSQVAQNSAKWKCNRLLKVFTDLREEGSNKFFGFKVEMDKLSPVSGDKNSGSTVVEGEYMRKYSYPIAQKTFDSLSPSAIANEILADLKKSGAVQPLR